MALMTTPIRPGPDRGEILAGLASLPRILRLKIRAVLDSKELEEDKTEL